MSCSDNVKDENGTETFNRWKKKMLEKLEKNQNSKKVLNELAKQYWLARRGILMSSASNRGKCIQFDSELQGINIREMHLVRTSTSRTRDLFLSLGRLFTELCELERNQSELFLNPHFGRETHSGIMLLHASQTVKSCMWSRMLLQPTMDRLVEVFSNLVKHGVADALTAFHARDKAAIHLQAGLMWIENLSKDLDPESPDKIRKFREVQKYVKESRSRLCELNVKASTKLSLVLASRNLIMAKEMTIYFNTLKDHFVKCLSEFQLFLDEFSGSPFYRFIVLEPILGPDNGGDPNIVEKYKKSSDLNSESFRKFSNELTKRGDDPELISLTSLKLSELPPSDVWPNGKQPPTKDTSDPVIFFDCNMEELLLGDVDFFLPDEALTVSQSSVPAQSDSVEQKTIPSCEPAPKSSIFDLEIEDLVNFTENPSSIKKASKYNTRKYQTLNDLATKLDSLDPDKGIESFCEKNEEKC